MQAIEFEPNAPKEYLFLFMYNFFRKDMYIFFKILRGHVIV